MHRGGLTWCAFLVVAVAVAAAVVSGMPHDHHNARVVLPPLQHNEHTVEAHSFHAPFLDHFWDPALHHWDFGLSTVITDSFVRLTPNKQSREGHMWNEIPCMLHSWRLRVGVRVHSLHSVGGDGMAIWYREKVATHGGPLWGSEERNFKGLGIILDSFDNDMKKDNPAVHIILGDGRIVFDTSKDVKDEKAGGCEFDFRNTRDGDVVMVDIMYNARTKDLNVGLTSTRQNVGCASLNLGAQNIELPTGYHFGLTAHTGALADNHDVHYFVVSTEEAMDEGEYVAKHDPHNHDKEKEDQRRWAAQPPQPVEFAESVPVPPSDHMESVRPPHHQRGHHGGPDPHHAEGHAQQQQHHDPSQRGHHHQAGGAHYQGHHQQDHHQQQQQHHQPPAAYQQQQQYHQQQQQPHQGNQYGAP